MTASARLHGLDVLRGVAMLFGVVLHASIAYQAGVRMVPWIEDNQSTSFVYDWLYLLINSFRMQLFFALAGFFCHLVITRKGLSYFVKNRSLRIVLPFLLSYLIILPATLAPFWYYQSAMEGANGFEHVKNSLIQFFSLKNRWGGVMHLWFLYHLILYYLIVLLWRKIQPMVFPQKEVSGESKYPAAVLLGVAVVTGILAQFYHSLLPTVWTGFKPPVVQVVYYGFFFFCGWVLYSYKGMMRYFDDHFKVLLAIGLCLSVVHTVLLNTYFHSGADSSPLGMVYKFTIAVQTITLSAGSIGAFNTWFSKQHTLGQYLSDAAYWVYLVHLPLVAAFQLVLLYSDIPGYVRFPAVVVASTGIALLMYHLMVRDRWIGLLLNGKK